MFPAIRSWIAFLGLGVFGVAAAQAPLAPRAPVVQWLGAVSSPLALPEVGALPLRALAVIPDGIDSFELLVDGRPFPATVSFLPGKDLSQASLEASLSATFFQGLGAGSHQVAARVRDKQGREHLSPSLEVRAGGSTMASLRRRTSARPLGAAGSVSGVVRRQSDGAPLAGVKVACWNPESGYFAEALSEASGAYSLADVPAGDGYRVYAYGAASGGQQYGIEFYPEARSPETAESIEVLASTEHPGVDFTLENGAAIEGTVRDAGGAPLAGVDVWALSLRNGFGWFASTDANGAYSLEGLYDFAPEADDYIVRVDQPGYVIQMWDHVRTLEQVTVVDVVESQITSGINFDLGAGGKIRGLIRDEGGAVLANVNVYAVSPSLSYARVGQTNSLGNFEIEGLEPAPDYKAGAFLGGFLPQFYDHQPLESATDISVVDQQTTSGIDFDLSRGAVIEGKIVSKLGLPLPGAKVTAFGIGAPCGGVAEAGVDGSYSISGLCDGIYKVAAEDTLYPRQFFVASGSTTPYWEQAGQVSATHGQAAQNIDLALELGTSSITGTITSSAREALPNAFVVAFQVQSGQSKPGVSDAAGHYSIMGLMEGPYIVGAFAQNFALEYYNEAASLQDADVVTVSKGQASSGVDFSLAAGGSIQGTVRDQAGNPLRDIPVTALTDSGAYVREASTDESGVYELSNLPFGQYILVTGASRSGNPVNVIDRWYNDKPTIIHADRLSLSSEQPNLSGVDFNLPPGAGISGDVKLAADQSPLSGVWVEAHYDHPLWEHFPFVATSQSGHYSIRGLPAGRYRINTRHPDYVTQFYNQTPYEDQATFVGLASEQSVTNVHFSLSEGLSISGTVKNSQQQPPAHAWVGAWSPRNANGNSVMVEPDGSYRIGGLLPGNDYFVVVEAPGYGGQTYPGQLDTTGGSLSGIDFVLEQERTITGAVRDSTGAPLQDALVFAYSSGDLLGEADLTDSSGNYDIRGLQSDPDYRVVVYHPRHAALWYDQKSNWQDADSVDLTGGNAQGIDFDLSVGRSASGVVRDAGGQPLEGADVWIWSESLQHGSGSRSGPDGGYRIDALPAASDYRAFCNHSSAVPALYPNPIDLSTQDRTGIDFQLGSGRTISGSITAVSGGSGIARASVVAWSPSLPEGFYRHVLTGLDGSYSLSGLPALPDYRVFAFAAGHGSIFYDGKSSVETADLVDVSAADAPGVDISLPDAEGCIEGTISGSLAEPVHGAAVVVRDASSQHVGIASTDPRGFYRTNGLAAGSYTVQVYHNDYPSPQPAVAASVAVSATGCAAWSYALASGGSISGVVSSLARSPLPVGVEAIVSVYDQSSQAYVSGATADPATGAYTVGGLPANGDYVVSARLSGGQEVWYDGKASIAAADPLSLAAGQSLTQIDIAVAPVAATAPPRSVPFGGQAMVASGQSSQTYSSARSPIIRWSEPLGRGAAVRGYSYLWDHSPASVPPARLMLDAGVLSLAGPELPDGVYYFHLRSVDSSGQWSDPVHVGPIYIDGSAPPPPGDFRIEAGNKRATLHWRAPAADVGGAGLAGTVVVRKVGGVPMNEQDGVSVSVDTQTPPGGLASFTDGALLNDVRYQYAVFAFDKAGNYSSNAAQGSAQPSPSLAFEVWTVGTVGSMLLSISALAAGLRLRRAKR